MENQSKLKILLLGFLAMLISACSNDISKLEQKVTQIIVKKYSDPPPPPKYVEFPKFSYVAQARDPFEKPRSKRAKKIDGSRSKRCAGQAKINPRRRREPLEAFALDSLRMVGVLELKGITWALLQTKDGTVHRIKPDHFIGQNHGVVTLVSDSKVVLREIVENVGVNHDADNDCPYRVRNATIALSQ